MSNSNGKKFATSEEINDPETPALPHALGHEKSVLSTFLREPHRLGDTKGLTSESFYLKAHRLLFETVMQIAAEGDEIELVTLVQKLIDQGQLDALGGAAAVTEIRNYSPTHQLFDQHVRELHQKHAERLFELAWRAAANGDEQEHSRLLAERDKVRELAESRNTLLERMEALRYDPDKPPPQDETVMTLQGVPIAAKGNLTTIQAKQKAGKSGLVSAIIAAAIRSTFSAQGDLLGLEWTCEAKGAILHLDTEQSLADHHAGIERARKRAGIFSIDRLHSYPVVQFSIDERWQALRAKTKALASAGKIDVIVLDGIADLIGDVNSGEESQNLVASLMRLSQEYACAVVVVIHENPSSDQGKTRGHLGSELARKSFANIRIDKDGETNISTVFGTEMRKGAIPKNHGLCFQWDSDAGMHVTIGTHSEIVGQATENKKAAEAFAKWQEIFSLATDENGTKSKCPVLSPQEAAKLIQDMNGTKNPPSVDAIKKQMQRAESLGVLRKNDRGTWTLNTNGTNGTRTGQC